MRSFTRAQVEQYVTSLFDDDPYKTLRVEDVKLIAPQDQAIWEVTYSLIEKASTYGPFKLLYAEHGPDAKYLGSATPIQIPAGCETVEEEDIKMKQIADEKHRQYLEEHPEFKRIGE